MNFDVRLSADAQSDLQDVINQYAAISKDLAQRFLTYFDQRISELEFQPYFQIRYGDVRMRQVEKFPVILHYKIFENSKIVIIYGVRFAQQDPQNYPNF